MATEYPPLNDNTIVEDFVGASCTLQAINAYALAWPPDIGYTPIPYHIVNRNTLHIQQSVSETACADRISALPHWHVPPGPRDQQTLPWLVIYPYHPIIDTWGTGHTNSSYPPHFIPTDEVDTESNPELFNLLPESLQNLWGNILISTRYRYILYHTNKKIRVKAAVFLTQRFNNTTPYFTNLRSHTSDAPLPAPSPELKPKGRPGYPLRSYPTTAHLLGFLHSSNTPSGIVYLPSSACRSRHLPLRSRSGRAFPATKPLVRFCLCPGPPSPCGSRFGSPLTSQLSPLGKHPPP